MPRGAADGRGLGVLDLARGLRSGAPHRASGEIALHVLEILEAIDRSARTGAFEPVLTSFTRPAALPEDWDPACPHDRLTSISEASMTALRGRPSLGVGVVGYAFMGAAHAQAWRTAAHVFDLPLDPGDGGGLRPGRRSPCKAAADRQGWASAETDWRALIARDDIQLVDVCTPGDLHAEIAIAALEARQARAVREAAGKHAGGGGSHDSRRGARCRQGIRSMVGFNYRRVPALAMARKLVADGRLGEIRHVRATYLQDWLTDPSFPLTWRLQHDRAGSGALGDLGAHVDRPRPVPDSASRSPPCRAARRRSSSSVRCRDGQRTNRRPDRGGDRR